MTGIWHEDAWGIISKIIYIKYILAKMEVKKHYVHLCAWCEVRFFTFLCRVDHFLQVGCFWLGSYCWRPHRSRRVAAVDRKAVYSWSNLSIQKWKSFIFKMGISIFWFSNSPVSSQHPAMFDYQVNSSTLASKSTTFPKVNLIPFHHHVEVASPLLFHQFQRLTPPARTNLSKSWLASVEN